MLLLPIPHAQSFQWEKIANIPLFENNEPLIMVASHPRLRVLPIYHQQGIPNSTEQIWLRKTLIQKLHKALSYLPKQYGFEILDGWRPLAVQAALRENFRQQIIQQYPNYSAQQIQQMLDEFVANPYRSDMTPPHNTGGSIDLTLFEIATGNTLNMGSHFDETSEQSYTAALENNPNHSAHKLRRLLYHTMLKAGFSNLSTEWWHYDYGNQNWAFFKKMPHAYFGKIQPNH